MRPRDPVLLFVAQLSSPKKVKRTSQPARKCKLTEVENNPILRSCEDEPRRRRRSWSTSHDDGRRGPASAEPRGTITVKRPARPEERREEQREGGDDPTRRQRVARAAVRLRALVAMTGKLAMISAGDVTSCTTAVVSVMSASRSCKNRACKTM